MRLYQCKLQPRRGCGSRGIARQPVLAHADTMPNESSNTGPKHCPSRLGDALQEVIAAAETYFTATPGLNAGGRFLSRVRADYAFLQPYLHVSQLPAAPLGTSNTPASSSTAQEGELRCEKYLLILLKISSIKEGPLACFSPQLEGELLCRTF
jgi:hypothetical protein